jgi:hypothetical protein
MSNQNSSGDDSNRDGGSPEDTFEGIELYDGLVQEDPGLRAFVEEQDGNIDSLQGEGDEQQGRNVDSRAEENVEYQDDNVDSLPEEGDNQLSGNEDSRPEENDEDQDGNVESVPAEGHTATAGAPEPGPCWQLGALANRFQAVYGFFCKRNNPVEVSEMLAEGIKVGIFPDPNSSLETKVHTYNIYRRNRRTNQQIREDHEAQEACNTAIYF